MNMDEVPLTFVISLKYIVKKTGTSMLYICTTGNEKSSFTVVLGCQAVETTVLRVIVKVLNTV